MLNMTEPHLTGADLRDLRVEAGVKGWELATEMRVHSSRVSQIEALATVTPATLERYRAALARLAGKTLDTADLA